MPYQLHWFPLYPADFLTDGKFLTLSDEQQAWFMKLLFHEWIDGSIPSDPKKCAAILGKNQNDRSLIGNLVGMLELMFRSPVGCDNLLVNTRLEKERTKQMAKYKKQVEGGKEGAKRRREKELSDTGNLVGNPPGIQ